MASVQFINLSKSFDGKTRAVREVNLAVNDGELVVLVGPSGCGKSTLLRMTAGLEDVTAGEIRIGERVVNDLPPQARDVAMVFQNYALYPHMTVRKNLAFPLKMRGLSKSEIVQRVNRVAGMLELEPLLDRRPKELSGGQRQRVAMGRALVREPAVFLMDEPLSNLDAKLRVQMRGEITALQRRLRTTTLYVTHDQVEAMTMGDRLAVLNRGELHQVGPPQQIYNEPADVFVATFIGSPSMNLFVSRLERCSSGLGFHWGKQWLPIAPERLAQYPAVEKYEGQHLLLGLRPEAFLPPGAVPTEQQIEVKLQSTELLGHEEIIYFRPEFEGFSAAPEARPAPGSLAADVFAREPLFAARLGSTERFSSGETLPMGMDTRRLFFFDLTGEAIKRENH